MGFLEYALSISLQKDPMKTRIRIKDIKQPFLRLRKAGYEIGLPIPVSTENNTISYLGTEFPKDGLGQAYALRLLRASVFHLTAHTLLPLDEQKVGFKKEPTMLARFSDSLVRDALVDTIVAKQNREALRDIAFAASVAFTKATSLERIKNSATRIMAAVLLKTQCGITKGKLEENEETAANQIIAHLNAFKQDFLVQEHGVDFDSKFLEERSEIMKVFRQFGPFLESPSLPYAECTGPSSVFSRNVTFSVPEVENILKIALKTQGFADADPTGTVGGDQQDGLSTVIAGQVFDSSIQQKAREERMLDKLRAVVQTTKLKSVSFPDEDYARYLRARQLITGGSRRLIDSLRIAADALDEDPGKEMGQLDLSAVIQVIASRKPATDVFLQDEYLSKSFAWAILFDASASMGVRGEFGRSLAICVAEAAKELLIDAQSWAFFAFSDNFYILKDPSEDTRRKSNPELEASNLGD
jgi:hypothetical protein